VVERTLFLIDQVVGVRVHGEDEDIGENVDAADDHERLGILHWDSLGDLHHPKDDDQVGAENLLADAIEKRGHAHTFED